MNGLLAARLDVVSAGVFTFGREETLSETKAKTAEVINKTKAHPLREAGAPTGRTILSAAWVGVQVGLLLLR